MFTLKNKEGNAVREVTSELKKDALLKEGWELAKKEPAKNAAKGKGKNKTGEAPAETTETDVEE